jgi:CHAD domain-containing protein
VRGSIGGQRYTLENRWFRDVARQLSALRDDQAMLENLDALAEDGLPLPAERLSAWRETLVGRRDRILAEVRARDGLRAVSADLHQALERVHSWGFSSTGFDALADGLSRTYHRGRKGLRCAVGSGDTDAFHDWRKRVKYLRHQLQLLAPACPRLLDGHAELLHDLTERLGFDHDLAVLEATTREAGVVEADSPAGRRLHAFIDERRAHNRRALRSPARCAWVEKRSRFVDRVRAYWQAAAPGHDRL